MLLSTIITLSILAAPQELSISRSLNTAAEISKFNGVEVTINQEELVEIKKKCQKKNRNHY